MKFDEYLQLREDNGWPEDYGDSPGPEEDFSGQQAYQGQQDLARQQEEQTTKNFQHGGISVNVTYHDGKVTMVTPDGSSFNVSGMPIGLWQQIATFVEQAHSRGAG